MRQSDLEAEMREYGVNRYRNKAARTKQQGIESQNPVGRRLLTESIELLQIEIQNWKKDISRYHVASRSAAYDYIAMLPSNMVAALTARSVINSISMREKITKSAFNVSRVLEDECRWRKLRREHPELWAEQKKMVKKLSSYETKRRFLNNSERWKNLQFDRWPRNIKLKVGVVLIELMKRATGLIDITTHTGFLGKKETWVHATPALMEWMKKAHEYAEDLSPMYLPMVERPMPPADVYSSGYLTENIPPRPLVKTRDKKHLEDLDAIGIESTRKTITILQDVQWEVDPEMYEVLKYCWEHDIEVGGLPAANGHPIPSKPVDIDTNKEARRKWRKAAARVHRENESERSRRLQIAKVLWIAKKYLSLVMYFPWYCDFRGRKYPRPHFLHPQSFEEAASLLRFHKGKPIGKSADWLAIHGASVYGHDKLTYEARVKWVDENQELILAVAEDPKGTISLWGKADKPWKFLAFCKEWNGYIEEGESFITKLPIQIDGSSNGLQLYSLLMRDPVGAAATNVLPTSSPQDIYADVAAGTLRRLRESDNPYAAKWLEFGVDRAACKRPTMVVPYSATLHACITYTIEWFRGRMKKEKIENPFGWEEIYKPCAFLAKTIWESIDDVVGEARKAMDWFKEISNICVANETPVYWTSPTGFLVKQGYETWAHQSVRTIIGDVIRQHRVRTGTGKLSKVKNRNGSSPNFIHTIDKSIAELAHQKNHAAGIESQVSNHDAFLGLACEMSAIQKNVLEAVVEIFSEDLLAIFAEEIAHYLPKDVELPPIPERGELDLNQIRKSLYFYG